MKLKILGTMQDGGHPHIGCQKKCCAAAWKSKQLKRLVVSLGIVDEKNNKKWLIECTPDLKFQLQELGGLDGIFITHGHVGHFAGLLQLEKCMLNTKAVPVWMMPQLQDMIIFNRPWKELVERKNIIPKALSNQQTINLGEDLEIIPFLVNHRDDFTETVGFKIIGPSKTVLFIPDVDNWQLSSFDLKQEIEEVDLAFLDGTFFNAQEVQHRDVKKIRHVFIEETMKLLKDLSKINKQKVNFIHFNHTNPVLKTPNLVLEKGFNLAQENQEILL